MRHFLACVVVIGATSGVQAGFAAATPRSEMPSSAAVEALPRPVPEPRWNVIDVHAVQRAARERGSPTSGSPDVPAFALGVPSETIVVDPVLTRASAGSTVAVLVRLHESVTPLFGYSLALALVPVGDATGSLVVDVDATNFFPAEHLILADPGGAPLDPLFSVILPSGSTGVFVNANTADLSTVLALPGVNDALAEVWITVGEDAVGDFDLVLGPATALSDGDGFAVPFIYGGATIRIPACTGSADFDGDGDITPIDLGVLLGDWGACPTLPSDIDDNGVVGSSDLAALLSAWGVCGGCDADLNGDGEVNSADLANLLGDWGLTVPPCADLDCDGFVTSVDLGLLLGAWGG